MHMWINNHPVSVKNIGHFGWMEEERRYWALHEHFIFRKMPWNWLMADENRFEAYSSGWQTNEWMDTNVIREIENKADSMVNCTIFVYTSLSEKRYYYLYYRKTLSTTWNRRWSLIFKILRTWIDKVSFGCTRQSGSCIKPWAEVDELSKSNFIWIEECSRFTSNEWINLSNVYIAVLLSLQFE